MWKTNRVYLGQKSHLASILGVCNGCCCAKDSVHCAACETCTNAAILSALTQMLHLEQGGVRRAKVSPEH